MYSISVLLIWCVLSHTSLMRVKYFTCHFCLWHLLSEILECRKWKKDQRNQIENETKLLTIEVYLKYIKHTE